MRFTTPTPTDRGERCTFKVGGQDRAGFVLIQTMRADQELCLVLAARRNLPCSPTASVVRHGNLQ